MASTIDSIAESLDKLTVLEAVELRKLLEERWDVSAAAPVAMMAGPAGGGDGGGGAAEKTDFDVELTATGDKKIQVIKAVRELTGLGLKEAKELVDAAPKVIKDGVTKDEADKMVATLEEAGATVTLK
ncbi:MAG: ribosomal protein [Thermoleophilia bacterium]|nr:ribosomal protein [Thermoleophilia bacterium]